MMKKLSDMIAHLTSSQFIKLIKDVYITAFTLDVWYDITHADIKFWIICYMLQKIELFQTVQHAVKHANIELF